MTTVREYHDRAMQLAQLALVSRYNDDYESARQFARQAVDYEIKAAELVPNSESSEPTRSILYRSAASLAYQAKEFVLARRLILQGLSGFPPPDIELELNNLYDQVRFEVGLQQRNASIEDTDIELTLRGSAVGAGTIPYGEFIRRVERTRSLIDKTVQRLLDRKFQRSGSVSKMYKPFVPLLTTPTEGSFKITIKLQRSDGQIPLFFDASTVIEQILSGIEFINSENEAGLRNLMVSEGYYTHFLSMAQDMAPDGEKISFLGFSSGQRNVPLNKRRNEIIIPAKPETEGEEAELVPIRVEGVLDLADSRRAVEFMGLTTDDGKQYDLVVQEGQDELVRSYYKHTIIVVGLFNRAKNSIYLTSLEPVEE